jgi:hypothetical protein
MFEHLLEYVNKLYKLAGSTTTRKEGKMIRLENLIALDDRQEPLHNHFGPYLAQDLDQADGSEVFWEGGTCGILMNEVQKNLFPLIWSLRRVPENQ